MIAHIKPARTPKSACGTYIQQRTDTSWLLAAPLPVSLTLPNSWALQQESRQTLVRSRVPHLSARESYSSVLWSIEHSARHSLTEGGTPRPHPIQLARSWRLAYDIEPRKASVGGGRTRGGAINVHTAILWGLQSTAQSSCSHIKNSLSLTRPRSACVNLGAPLVVKFTHSGATHLWLN